MHPENDNFSQGAPQGSLKTGLSRNREMVLFLLFGLLTIVADGIGGVQVVLLFVFYRHGKSMFIRTAVFFFIVISILTFFRVNAAGDFRLDAVITEGGAALGSELEAQGSVFITKGMIFFQKVVDIMSLLGGIYFFVALSKYSWARRLLASTSIYFLGSLPFHIGSFKDIYVSSITALFEEISQSYPQIRIDGTLVSHAVNIAFIIIPLISIVYLLFSWFITTFILSMRLKFNFTQYMRYIMDKILREQPRKRIWPVVLLVSAIPFLYNRFEGEGVILSLCVTAVLFVLGVLFIIGLAYSYQRFVVRILRPDWYLFLICIIMVVPILNIALITVFMMLGTVCNMRTVGVLSRKNNIGAKDENNFE